MEGLLRTGILCGVAVVGIGNPKVNPLTKSAVRLGSYPCSQNFNLVILIGVGSGLLSLIASDGWMWFMAEGALMLVGAGAIFARSPYVVGETETFRDGNACLPVVDVPWCIS